MLGRSRIADHFSPAFFKTHFWLMWCTTFAFQPWHSAVEFKRYLLRFVHMVSGFNPLHGIMRTVYNQYDSMVRPLSKWLGDRGVQFQFGTRVSDLVLNEANGETRVEGIVCEREGRSVSIPVGPRDAVIVTLGSMTEGSTLGGMDRAAVLNSKVVVIDPREEFGASFEVPGITLSRGMPDDVIAELQIDVHTAIVGLTHDPKLDDMALMEALKSPAFYVGALGSRINTEKRKERLLEFDLTRAQVDRLQGPTGLFIGSRTPAEMAISILAEITAAKYQVPVLQRRSIPEPQLIERARCIDSLSTA